MAWRFLTRSVLPRACARDRAAVVLCCAAVSRTVYSCVLTFRNG